MSKKWWKEAVVYQIYPKSFRDSNGDGIGDLQGIIQQLPYLQQLGVNVIWLCPVYRSPMDDNGYDIADYYQVDPMFGTNEDLDELIQKAAEIGIKIIMDLVINHTSNEHSWFQQALADPTSKYRDYYVFRKGENGAPPNNWRSYFGASAWSQIGTSGDYYLHAFSEKMPDLNWENQEVRQELYKMVNYWLAKGLGGFRIDAILNIKKNIEFGEFPPDGEDGYVYIGDWILNQPGVGDYLNELNQETFKKYDSMTVAEADVPDEMLGEYINEETGYFSMVFDFAHSDIDVPATGEWYKKTDWTVDELKQALLDNQLVTQRLGWGALYFENHDQPRSVNKYIPAAEINDTTKKMLATLFMCLRGTPFIYQGQELGMSNIKMDSISDYNDIATHDQYQRALLTGMEPSVALNEMFLRSRDNARTPMQWENTLNAGFSEAHQTWLKVNPNYSEVNAQAEQLNSDSVLNYYKQLIQLRRSSPWQEAMVYGEFIPVYQEVSKLIAYQRKTAMQTLLVVTNFQNQATTLELTETVNQVLLNNLKDYQQAGQRLTLAPYQSLILAVNGKEVEGDGD